MKLSTLTCVKFSKTTAEAFAAFMAIKKLGILIPNYKNDKE